MKAVIFGQTLKVLIYKSLSSYVAEIDVDVAVISFLVHVNMFRFIIVPSHVHNILTILKPNKIVDLRQNKINRNFVNKIVDESIDMDEENDFELEIILT